MISKTVDEIRSEMMTALLGELPNLDLTDGTPERDLFIEAPISGQLLTLWDSLVYATKTASPFLYYEDLSDTEIKSYLANYNVSLRAATQSVGTVTFYTTVTPTTDIIIDSGSIVRTNSSSPVEFYVDGNYTLYASIESSYYNPTKERWEISCSVRAVNAGPDYRAGANTVTVMVTSISGITGCNNDSAITGGLDEESIDSALKRVIDKFQGRGLATLQGLRSYVQSYTQSVNIVSGNDSEMLRDEGLGGAVDIYVIGTDQANASDSVTITSTGLNSPTTINYTNKSIVLLKQPVISIASVLKNGTIISINDYELIKDTGILKNSTASYDRMELTSTGISSTGYFQVGDIIEVNYLYNEFLSTIQDDLNSTTNYYINRDYLVRGMTEVTINVAFKFKELAGQDFDTISSAVSLSVASFIDGILNAGSVEKADIVGVAKTNPSVDNIDLSSVVLTPIGGGTVLSSGDISLAKNEYPMSGTITLTRWTY